VRHVIGIDLGTTYSVVAYVNDVGKAVTIRNDFNRAITPSLIYFGAGKPVVGDEAKEQQKAGKTEIAAFFKRNMDDKHFLRTFDDKDYTAVDLSALVLAYLKAQAERHFNVSVTDAVITVPAYFTNIQREATIKAGEQAGLRVLKIISEPTAAALGYGWYPQQEEQFVLVYDLGGGTFDISLVAVTEKTLQVIATEGDHHLGGKDWDDRLLAYLAKQFTHDFVLDLSDEEFEGLRFPVERAKHALSVRQSAGVTVQVRNQSNTYTITRTLFEDLTSDLMERTQSLTEATLRKVGKSWGDIHGVLLVGGSTRMPMVRSYIERMSGKPPMTGINPDEAVALGAAIQASIECEEEALHLSGCKATIDAIAHSLGVIVESADRSQYVNSIIIEKNMPIPATQIRSFEVQLRPDGQTQMEVFLTQGESNNPQQCIYIGRYVFSNFPSIASPTVIVDITYQYDSNGVVHVSAVERSSQQALKLSVEELPPNVPARFVGEPSGKKAAQEPLTVYLTFDLSKSMGDTLLKSGSMDNTALEETKKAAYSFVRRCDLQTMSIGLVSFSDAAMVNIAATKDEKALRRSIDQLTVERTGHGNNGHPFEELYDALSKTQGLRRAVVLTDGVWSYQDKAIQQARRCHAAGIEVITVGFKQADRDFLARVASSRERSLFIELNQLTDTLSTIARELIAESGGKERKRE